MQFCSQWLFFCFMIKTSREVNSQLLIMIILFLVIWIIFIKFFGRLKGGLCENSTKKFVFHIFLHVQLFFFFSFVLFCFMSQISWDECWKLREFIILQCFLSFYPVVFGKDKQWLILELRDGDISLCAQLFLFCFIIYISKEQSSK